MVGAKGVKSTDHMGDEMWVTLLADPWVAPLRASRPPCPPLAWTEAQPCLPPSSHTPPTWGWMMTQLYQSGQARVCCGPRQPKSQCLKRTMVDCLLMLHVQQGASKGSVPFPTPRAGGSDTIWNTDSYEERGDENSMGSYPNNETLDPEITDVTSTHVSLAKGIHVIPSKDKEAQKCGATKGGERRARNN